MRDMQLSVVYASWPDEEFLVAEVWSGEDYVGHVRRSAEGDLLVEFRPTDGVADGITLGELERTLASIRARLTLDDIET